MKSTIEFIDGSKKVIEEAAPSVDPESGTITFVDQTNGVIDEFQTSDVKRVEFDL